MKYSLMFLLALVLLVSSCSTEKEKVTLSADSPAYVLAKDLAAVSPALDPDSNKVIVSTDFFDVTTGEVIQVLQRNFGPRTDELKKMDANRLLQIIQGNGARIAEQKLLLTTAENEGYSVSDEMLDSLLKAQYEHVGGEEVFLNYLQKSGMTIDFVKEDIARGYVVEKYMDKVLSDAIQVSDEQLQEKYNELTSADLSATVRHILFMTQGKTDAEKKSIQAKANTVLARAKKGEDFAKLAETYSDDPGSKNKGGLYENFKRGTMVKPFEDAAFNLPIGAVSDLVETQYGYHIIQIVSRQKETRSFDEMKDELKKDLRKGKERETATEHIAKLKEDAHFETKSL
ncbi:MAG: hypothetical protein E4H13_07655 [Calditrichales bacterium]|nr:MAG: hypothetical protein E4H13_07655 [Calditrichales bacterium]